jgi:hypothetical protein
VPRWAFVFFSQAHARFLRDCIGDNLASGSIYSKTSFLTTQPLQTNSATSPSQAQMPGNEIQSIFLSATATDCAVYRQELRDALQKHVPVTVHLQEDWAGAASPTVTACKNKIVEQDGYIGLFGYRYGWQPWLPTSKKSITHLEWEFAVEHWISPVPPIFLFLPSPGEEADRELKRWADEVLQQEHPNSETERQASLDLQQSFLKQVHEWDKNRFINSYKTVQDLREMGIASIHHWNRTIWKEAAQGRGGTTPPISEAELGAIGRSQQLETLARILSELWQHPQEVAAAFVVHGKENHGQRQFANYLPDWDEWQEEDLILPPSRPDRPEDAKHLARWVCERLGQAVTLADAMDILVAALAARLRQGNVVVILHSLGNSPDRWLQFSSGFWKPLQQRLGEVSNQKWKGRFVLFVVDQQPCPTDQNDIFNSLPSPLPEAALDWDTTQLIPLPELRHLRQSDVMDWLSRRKPMLNGGTIKYEQKVEISRSVTCAGGVPALVFDRLKNIGTWHFPS